MIRPGTRINGNILDIMIVDQNITAYIHSLDPDAPGYLAELREYAEEHDVPIIRQEMESFMKVLLKMNRPKRILEIGTAIGYSTLFMNECLEETQIVTMENYEPRLQEARKNLAGHDNIKLIEGDAVQNIKNLQEGFDMIFLDAAKAQYIVMLPDLLRLLNEGGILLADNVLQDGELIRSRYVTPRRQRTIHSRMREFIWEVKHMPELTTSIITIGDGVVLAYKNNAGDICDKVIDLQESTCICGIK